MIIGAPARRLRQFPLLGEVVPVHASSPGKLPGMDWQNLRWSSFPEDDDDCNMKGVWATRHRLSSLNLGRERPNLAQRVHCAMSLSPLRCRGGGKPRRTCLLKGCGGSILGLRTRDAPTTAVSCSRCLPRLCCGSLPTCSPASRCRTVLYAYRAHGWSKCGWVLALTTRCCCGYRCPLTKKEGYSGGSSGVWKLASWVTVCKQ